MKKRSVIRSAPSARAFTMIELLVSLLMGLIVAMAVVGLSKEATNTFHEEARISVAESGARIAIDRLRADLQRAGLMSTGNITTDPTIAVAPGSSNTAMISSADTGLLRLASLHLYNGGATIAANAAETQNSLAPDMLDIAGNFTTADQYPVEYPDVAGSCQRLWLVTDAPPIWRIMASGTANASTILRNIFQPAPSTSNAQFIVRYTDDSGRHQYIPTCNGSATPAGISGGRPYVDIDPGILQTAHQTQTVGGASNISAGRSYVNPVQIVRWDLQYNGIAGLNPGNDTQKFDLVRSYVDALGNVVAGTTEVIAEYAVDLKFAFTVDSATNPTLNTTNTLTSYQFDDAANATFAADPTTSPATTPQRIRAVRVRLVTRAAFADRTVAIVPAPANINTEKFLYRYLLKPGFFARSRTVTTEVGLQNQARNYY